MNGPSRLPPLAPMFRPVPVRAVTGVEPTAGADPKDGVQLSDDEYRTVLAAQRTLLAFLRTSLAVLVVFGDSAYSLILASLVAAVGVFQFGTTAALYLVRGDAGGRVDARALLSWTQTHSVLVVALVVVVAAIAIPWRHGQGSTATTPMAVFD